MVRDDRSTLWELWTPEASPNHGWSGGPLIILGKYIAGLRPEGDGSRWTIAPHLCGLRHVECVCPTRFGPLRVRIDREPHEKRMEVEVPQGLHVTIQTPDGEERSEWTIHSRTL